uniref:Uncharacterized protein n=2 Tax=Oryza TaxID=4527 RepID=A0A0E0QL21_ORYRU
MEVQTTDASHLGVVASGGDGQGRHNCLKNLQFVSLFVLARSVREVVETKAGDLRSLLCEGCTTAKSLSDDGITSIFSGVHGFGFSPWYTFTIALVEVTSTQ